METNIEAGLRRISEVDSGFIVLLGSMHTLDTLITICTKVQGRLWSVEGLRLPILKENSGKDSLMVSAE